MEFTYIAWGSGEIVSRAFNALALISLSVEFIAALAAASLLGLIFLSVSSAVSGNFKLLLSPLRLVVVLTLVTGVLLAPTTVLVEDRFDGQELLWDGFGRAVSGVTVVSQVPIGVALPASFASHIGAEFTDLIETAMGVVEEQEQISISGMWLNARALRMMVGGRGVIDDVALPIDFGYFIENCVYFDLIATRTQAKKLLNESVIDSINPVAGGLTSVHAGELGQGVLKSVNCQEAWLGNNDPDPAAKVYGIRERLSSEGFNWQFQACQALRGLSLAQDRAAINRAQLEARDPQQQGRNCGNNVFTHSLSRFGFDLGVADAFEDIVSAELFRDYVYQLSSSDPSQIAFGKFIAQRQRNASYVVAGELAATVLPILRGILEAVIIVLLPIVLVVSLIMFEQMGSYLKNSLLMTLWIHLWPPVMAVINQVGSWMQIIAVNEQAIVSQGFLSPSSLTPLLDELDTQLAISRYLLVITPMLSYALIKSGGFGGALLAGKLLQPSESAATSVAGNIATNSWSADQINLAPRAQLGASSVQVRDVYGGSATHFAEQSTQELPTNDPGYIQARQTQSIVNELGKHKEQAQTQSSEHGRRFSSSVEAVYSEAFGKEGREILSSLREHGVSDKTAYRALDATSTSVQVASSAVQAQSDEQLSSGTFQVSAGAASDWLPVIDISGKASEESKSSISTSFRDSVEQQNSEQISALREVGQTLEKSGRQQLKFDASKILSSAFRASLNEAQKHDTNFTESSIKAERISEAMRLVESEQQSVVYEMLRDPKAYEMLSTFHHLYSSEQMSQSQAWQEAQRQSGYRIEIDSLVDKLLNNSVDTTQNEFPQQSQIRELHDSNLERVTEQPQSAQSTPASFSEVENQIEQGHREIEQKNLKDAPRVLVGRERLLDAEPSEQGTHVPERPLVIDSLGQLGKNLRNSRNHYDEEQNKDKAE